MNSQQLVVDLTDWWLGGLKEIPSLQCKLDIGNVVVLNSEPDYPGMEKIQGKVMWNRVYKLDDPRMPERDLLIHELFRKFAVATGSTIVSIRHVDLVTYIDYKVTELKNVTDMEWMSVELVKEIIL